MCDVADGADRDKEKQNRPGHVYRHVRHFINVQQSSRPGSVFFDIFFRMLFAGFVCTWIDIVSRCDVLRTKKVHEGVFVGKLFMIAKVVRQNRPEQEAQKEQNDGANKNWKP